MKQLNEHIWDFCANTIMQICPCILPVAAAKEPCPGVTTVLPCGLTTINCVFPWPAILGIEDRILVGVWPAPAAPLGAAMTMVLAPVGVVCRLACPAFTVDSMEEGIVRITVFVCVCWNIVQYYFSHLFKFFKTFLRLHFALNNKQVAFGLKLHIKSPNKRKIKKGR